MKVKLTVEIELQHISGKFATKDDVAEALCDELESADPGSVYGVGDDGDTEYEITDFSVEYVG